ncbi:hypothetical protein ScPMuIL_018956 [Solemya velum]
MGLEKEQHRVPDTVIEKLTSTPVLAYADFDRPFIRNTDAFTFEPRAVLHQEQDGCGCVVAYASRGLRSSYKNILYAGQEEPNKDADGLSRRPYTEEKMFLDPRYLKFCIDNWPEFVLHQIFPVSPLTDLVKMATVEEKIATMTVTRQTAFQQLEENLGDLTPESQEVKQILQLNLMELREKLQRGELRAIDVLHAYQVKALEVNRELNCVTEPIPEAEEIAVALDNKKDKTGQLHGIPISVKENIELKGYQCTAGLSCRLGVVSEDDSSLIQVLKAEGAVPFMRTNIPQTMLTIQCSNPIFGETSNPYDISRTPGGSSGGEGALIGAGGSLLGIGNDIGGSLRIPAAFCGIYSLKPTSGRITLHGTWGPLAGQNSVIVTNGPMANDVDSLVVLLKVLFAEKAFLKDYYLPPIPFRNEIYGDRKPLVIGYSYNDGFKAIEEACVRAVSVTKDVLDTAGHKLVPFFPPKVGHAISLACDSYFGDGCSSVMSVLDGDTVDQVMQKPYEFMKKYAVDRESSMAEMGYKYEEGVRYCSQTSSVRDWWDLVVKVMQYRAEFLHAWKEANIDVLIYPSYACTAFRKGMSDDAIDGLSYTALWNLLNYPVGVVPVTKVTADDVQKTMSKEGDTKFIKFLKKV